MSSYQSLPYSNRTPLRSSIRTVPPQHPRFDWIPEEEEDQVNSEATDSLRGTDDNSSPVVDRSRNKNDRSYLHWWKPVSWMICLIVLGLAFGTAHHIFYRTLHNRPTSTFSQTWSHNLGNVAAFGIKTSCTLSVALACQEVLWYSVRRKGIQVSTLDNMFTLLSDPLSFTYAAVRDAPLLSLLAAFAWLIPLSAILSPGTLTVGPHTVVNNANCLVPKFPADTSILYGTEPHGTGVNGPNRAVVKLASQVFPYGTPVGFTSPCGSNCTYRQIFFGPALECAPSADTIPAADYNITRDVFFYNASASVVPIATQTNTLMELYLMYKNSSTPLSTGESPTLPLTFITCSAYNATYDVTVNFTNGILSFDPQVKTDSPLLWMPQSQITSNGGDLSQPNFQSLVMEVFNQLSGSWSGSATTATISADTLIGDTSLVGNKDLTGSDLWQINKDLVVGIPELMVNLTLAAISFNTANETTQCATSNTFQAYKYKPFWLVLPYSLALFASVVAAIVSTTVLKGAGIRTGSVFSQILVTTRNPDLDKIAVGNSLSSSGDTELKKQKLRLGELSQQKLGEVGYASGTEECRHAAFGLEDQVLALKRATRYL